MVDDNFVNTLEFRSFWLRQKLKSISDEEISNFDKDNFNCTPQEGKDKVMNSGMLLVPNWNFERIFLLDQIIWQKDPNFAREFGEHVSGISISSKAFVVWSKAPRTQKPIVLQGVQQKIGDAIVRMLEDTTASKAVAISKHAVQFAQLPVEDLKQKHVQLKDMHVALNAKYNELFIENIALKEQIKKLLVDSSGEIRPRELEKMNKEMQRVKDEAKNNYFKIKKDSILRISNKIIDKLNKVHTSYSLTSKLLSQIDEFISFFQLIRATWLSRSQILNEVMLAVKNVA